MDLLCPCGNCATTPKQRWATGNALDSLELAERWPARIILRSFRELIACTETDIEGLYEYRIDFKSGNLGDDRDHDDFAMRSANRTTLPAKKRTVYTPPPTGSLLGGGYTSAGDTDARSQSTEASTICSGSSDKASFRQALAQFDAQSRARWWTVMPSSAPAVRLQTVFRKTLKWQRQKTGMTYGELLVTNSLANGSGKSFNDILAMKNKGQSWSQISQSLRINIDSITTRLKTAEESVKYTQSRKKEKRNQNVGDTMRDIERGARPAPGS